MRTRVVLERLVVLATMLLVGLPAHAVDLNATLKGVVTDPDGLPVPNAEISLESTNLLGEHETTTDAEGRYRFVALPPGDYVVRALHPSFAPYESGLLTVALSATVTVDIELAASGSGESITVVGTAPAVDVESVRTGAILDAEFLKNIPSGRDYQSAITVAPGIVGAGNPNAHGSFDSSNQYYIDGVNTTDPVTNTFSMNMNYDAIESIEVITGGMDAEYGRALGAAFNIVTKSGGNEFEGSAFLSYTNNDMVVAPELEGDSQDDTLYQQATLNLGGPIVKDKVWFFTSVELNRFQEGISIDPTTVPRDLDRYPVLPRNYQSLYLFGKVTAQPIQDHRVWAHLQADPTKISNVEQSPWTLPSGESIQAQGGWLASVGHQWTPNDDMLVETQLFFSKSVIDYYSVLWEDCENFDENQACTDDFVGTEFMGEPVPSGWFGYGGNDFSAGELPYASINRRYRSSLTSSLTYWFDAAGEHEAKIGFQGEMLDASYIYPGLGTGYEYWTATPDPITGETDYNNLDSYTPALKIIYDSDLDTHLRGSILSFYVQDVYKPIPRLSLRPGLRFDMPMMKNDVGDAVLNKVTVAPRMGAAYQLTGDGKTKVFGYYGRFYDSGFLGVSDLLNKNPSGYGAYGWEAGDTNGDGTVGLTEGNWATVPDYTVASTFLAHSDIRNPYSDEFNFGFSREVGDNWGLDVVGVYEQSSNFWEDDEVNLIWNEDGTDVIGYRNGKNEAIYRLRTPDDTYTRYTSLELVARKSFSDNWTMLASYTWSRTYGTNSGDQATYVHDIPQQYQYEIGVLDYDVPHYLKIAGSYSRADLWSIGRLRGGYTIGWNSFARSGYAYRPIVWNDYYQSFNNYTEVGDGKYRLPMRTQTDLRFMLEFEVGSADDPSGGFGLGLECFNVFNDRTTTSVNTEFDPEAVGADQPFGQILDRQDPRYFQAVLRGEF